MSLMSALPSKTDISGRDVFDRKVGTLDRSFHFVAQSVAKKAAAKS